MDVIKDLLAMPMFTIGDTQTTLGTLLATCIVVIATLLVGRLSKKALQRLLGRFSEKEAASEIDLCVYTRRGAESAEILSGLILTNLYVLTGTNRLMQMGDDK